MPLTTTSFFLCLLFLFSFFLCPNFYFSSIHEGMRDQMERLVVLPFSIGCVSQSSIAVIGNHPKKTKPESNILTRDKGESGACFAGARMNNSSHPKSSISSGLQRLIRSLKRLSQLFVYKEEFVEMEMEMDIGLPTDVKHVAHIGWDDSITSMKGWDELKSPELLSLPSISLHQFELAMAAQADAPSIATSATTPKFG